MPLQVRDRDGQLAPAQNPFDKPLFVPQQERTAHRHLVALGAALEAANDGLKLSIEGLVTDIWGDSINFMFAPTLDGDRPFLWGTKIPNMTARDALIDLLDHSATTFYWDMKCMGTLTVRYNECFMYIAPVEIGTVGPDGKPINPSGHIETMVGGQPMVECDRCGGCEGGRALGVVGRPRQ